MINETRIKVRESGPYLVTGTLSITDCDGRAYTVTGENMALCRCGHSENKPFCDGSHKRNGFIAIERAPEPEPAKE